MHRGVLRDRNYRDSSVPLLCQKEHRDLILHTEANQTRYLTMVSAPVSKELIWARPGRPNSSDLHDRGHECGESTMYVAGLCRRERLLQFIVIALPFRPLLWAFRRSLPRSRYSYKMALVPFSYASPFTDQLQLAERLFTIDGRLLKIQQVWTTSGLVAAPIVNNNRPKSRRVSTAVPNGPSTRRSCHRPLIFAFP